METLKALEGTTKGADREGEAAAKPQDAQDAKDGGVDQGAREWALIPFSIGGLVCMIEPQLKAVYTEERCLTWGKHAHQVAAKWGWDGPANLPELALLASTVTFALPTVFGLRARIEEIRKANDGNIWQKMGVWWRERARAKAEAKAARRAAGSKPKAGEGAKAAPSPAPAPAPAPAASGG